MKKQKRNNKKMLKMQNGITLIALVISIIVMLILAGVSISAVVGDNGVLTQAREATIKQKCAEIQEYLQEFYTAKYMMEDTGTGRLDKLKQDAETTNWIYKGKLGYILDKSLNMHYFLDVNNCPEEIQKIVGTWDKNKQYSDYVACKDVFGITDDLSVYYCSNGLETLISNSPILLGREDGTNVLYNADSSIAKLVNSKVDPDTGEIITTPVTTRDLRGITDLEITSSSGLDNLNDLYNFVSLNKLTLTGLNFENLNGIEFATSINCVFINNCHFNDYSALAKLPNLQYLFIRSANNDDVETLCDNSKRNWR